MLQISPEMQPSADTRLQEIWVADWHCLVVLSTQFLQKTNKNWKQNKNTETQTNERSAQHFKHCIMMEQNHRTNNHSVTTLDTDSFRLLVLQLIISDQYIIIYLYVTLFKLFLSSDLYI